jgi:DNA-binding transcriptional regulator/RsmH inhibitor MraZ
MPDVRTSAALRQLHDLGPGPDEPRWRWAVVRVEPTGRIILPAAAREILGVGGTVRGTCNRVASLLRPDGAGAEVAIDGRGRVRLPAWPRTAAGVTGSVVVGSGPDLALVVVAPTDVLDGLGDLLVGGRR